ncbi:hypothetical protein FRC02_002553 [Tulasnella sp. 418]|nr:hypothetical protein FRC02_002553 [Tulasnella sp. 418]
MHPKISVLISLIYLATSLVFPAAATPVPFGGTTSLSPGRSSFESDCPKSLNRLTLADDVVTQILKSANNLSYKFERPPFPNNKVTDMEILGEGSFGCVYGIKHEGTILAVVKLYKDSFKDEPDLQRKFNKEMAGLEQVNELFGSSKYVQDRKERGLIFMKYVPGVPVWRTNGYKEVITAPGDPWTYNAAQDKSGEKLIFYEKVLRDAMRAHVYYCTNYHVTIRDFHLGNILFDKNYPNAFDYNNPGNSNLPKLIDLESWIPCSDEETTLEAYYERRLRIEQQLGLVDDSL